MTSHLPAVSCADTVKAFERAGWRVKRWGNHVVMVKSGSFVSLSIPNHREIAKGTLRKLIRLAGMSTDEFTQFLLP